MAKPELGEKRRCLSCESKFYDLNKEPPVCPKCGAVFELQEPEKIEPDKKVAEEDPKVEDVVVVSDPDTISLEDADDDDGVTVDGEEIPDDIPDVETDDDGVETDDTFLEDDDDNDELATLVTVTKDEADEV